MENVYDVIKRILDNQDVSVDFKKAISGGKWKTKKEEGENGKDNIRK